MRFILPAGRSKSSSAPSVASLPPGLGSGLASGSAHESRGTRELRDLLHLRLRSLTSIALLLLTGLALFGLRVMPAPQLIGVLVLLALMLVPTVLLWLKRDLSMRTLRRIDLGVLLLGFLMGFASCLGRVFYAQSVATLPDQAFHGLTARGIWYYFADGSIYIKHGSTAACNHIVLNWGLFAVGYSVAIPNTWRRSAIIMAFVTLSALLCVGIDAYLHPGLRQVLVPSLFNTSYIVGGFAAIGLYGSHKLEVLRSAASEARQVGQYSLKRVLGRGGMGEVYLAQHRLLRRPCAVKLIRTEQAGNASNLVRFEREVQAMAQLTHPNTVEIYDYGRTDEGMFYYAMEYLPGLTTEELVKRHGLLPPGRAIHLLRQVCGALSEAHESGLIHRDIKPGNIFVCERGRIHDVVKLLDFGLVQVADAQEPPPRSPPGPSEASNPGGSEPSDLRLTQAGHILGTPAYMSPEQGREELADARSDIYSVGAVAYFLLTGKPPFLRPTVAQMVEAHQKEPPPPLPEALDPELVAVVMRCLEKAPDRRYQTVKELLRALSSCPSAAGWDAEQAAQWWRERAASGQPLPSESPSSDASSASPASSSVEMTTDLGGS